MTQSAPQTENTASGGARPFLVIAVILFMIFWITGFTASITASACRKDRIDPDRRLRHCTISLTLNQFLPGDPKKLSPLHLEYAILLARSGDTVAAKQGFQRAILAASGGKPITATKIEKNKAWIDSLLSRLAREPSDGPAIAVWKATLGNTMSGQI